MLTVLGWIVFGFVVGAIARFLMPGPQPMGMIMTTILGIVGSFVGGTLWNVFHGGSFTDPTAASWLGAILGAFIVLFIFGMVASRRPNV
jgi:uncharacterized membrane protein YeaQ/YmgE (transglycosylase-associated protein family)